MKVFYSPLYIAAQHGFDTTRKAALVADSLIERPIPGVQVCPPLNLGPQFFETVHTPEYVAAVRTGTPRQLAESQGFKWDPELWWAMCASNGGVVDAVAEALDEHTVSGSLSSGLHHAMPAAGAGYCTFNGLAIGALAALRRGAKHVLILDLDAHCGGGTYYCTKTNHHISMTDISVSDFDSYRSESQGYTLDIVEKAEQYLSAIQMRLREHDHKGRQFDLVLYNAGMDPYEGCDVGGLAGITKEVIAQRERMVFEWIVSRDTPAVFVLAGGYSGPKCSNAELVNLHGQTIWEAAFAAEKLSAKAISKIAPEAGGF